MKAMILAAGGGTRLGTLTSNMPKAMLPIGNRPLLEWILRWLNSNRIKQVAINLHHFSDKIVKHFGDGSQFDMEITYSCEQSLLGTAGAVKRLEWYWDEPFLVVYGDVLTDMDLSSFIIFHMTMGNAKVSLTAHEIKGRLDVGLMDVDAEGRVRRFLEKPSIQDESFGVANCGILIVDPDVLKFIPDGEFCDFGLNLLPILISEGIPIYAWNLPHQSVLIDVGTPERYVQALALWENRMHGNP